MTNMTSASNQAEGSALMLSPTSTYIATALQNKNVRIHKRRTSVRLEPKTWSALNEIASLEGCSIHDLCAAVHDIKSEKTSFTAALRVFMMEYYRSAAHANGQVYQIQGKIRSSLGHNSLKERIAPS